MIGFLFGVIDEYTEDNLLLEVGHVGYNVKISPATAQALPGLGREIKIYTYTSVREDAIWLYGFLTKDELNLFKQLITVNGIGPKGALGILSAMDVTELRLAIVSGDAKKISKAPGIGAKTAERLILDLKDKVSLEDTLGFGGEATPLVSVSRVTPNISEAVEALTSLGYSASESLKAVQNVEGAQNMEVEVLLKAALKQMAFL